jgi:hypothetical protein
VSPRRQSRHPGRIVSKVREKLHCTHVDIELLGVILVDLHIRIVVGMSQTLRSTRLGPRVEVQMVSSRSQCKGILFTDIVQGCAVLAPLKDGPSVGVHLGVICGTDGCAFEKIRRIRKAFRSDIPSSKSCPKLSASSGLVKNFPSSYYSRFNSIVRRSSRRYSLNAAFRSGTLHYKATECPNHRSTWHTSFQYNRKVDPW